MYLDANSFFQVNSNKLVDAVDACFKLMMLLDINFPSEAKTIWSFIQLYIYKILPHTVYEYNKVNSSIASLNNIQLEVIEVPPVQNEISLENPESMQNFEGFEMQVVEIETEAIASTD